MLFTVLKPSKKYSKTVVLYLIMEFSTVSVFNCTKIIGLFIRDIAQLFYAISGKHKNGKKRYMQ